LALSPLSFYMFAAYSESTFLLCALAFFYTLRLQRWWQAGLWGLLAAATRPPGVVLVVPFLLAWAEAHPLITHAPGGLLHLTRRAQQAWWRTSDPPWETLYHSAVWPSGNVLRAKLTYCDPVALNDLAYEIAGRGLTCLACKRVLHVERVYLGLLWVMILSSPAM